MEYWKKEFKGEKRWQFNFCSFSSHRSLKMEKGSNLPPYPGPQMNQTNMPYQVQPVAYQHQPGKLTLSHAPERDWLNWFCEFASWYFTGPVAFQSASTPVTGQPTFHFLVLTHWKPLYLSQHTLVTNYAGCTKPKNLMFCSDAGGDGATELIRCPRTDEMPSLPAADCHRDQIHQRPAYLGHLWRSWHPIVRNKRTSVPFGSCHFLI